LQLGALEPFWKVKPRSQGWHARSVVGVAARRTDEPGRQTDVARQAARPVSFCHDSPATHASHSTSRVPLCEICAYPAGHTVEIEQAPFRCCSSTVNDPLLQDAQTTFEEAVAGAEANWPAAHHPIGLQAGDPGTSL